MGDIGNLTITGDTGVQTIQLTRDLLELNGGGASETIIGRAVIIHQQPDTCGLPNGGAGTQIAQGVIGIAPPTGGAIQMASANIAVGASVTSLVAVLKPTTNAGASSIVGQVQFIDLGAAGVRVVADITGLAPNHLYPLHVHQVRASAWQRSAGPGRAE